MKRLMILGAGGFGRTVADVAAQSRRWEEILFLDDGAQSEEVVGKCGDFEKFIDCDTQFFPAFGNNGVRSEWLRRLESAGCSVPVIVHAAAYVSPSARLGAGTVVLPTAVVNTGCTVGAGGIINCGAVVDHDCVLGECVHVCLNATVKGENRIPELMKIEAGEVVPARKFPL